MLNDEGEMQNPEQAGLHSSFIVHHSAFEMRGLVEL
jgi:hypothetical protein